MFKNKPEGHSAKVMNLCKNVQNIRFDALFQRADSLKNMCSDFTEAEPEL